MRKLIVILTALALVCGFLAVSSGEKGKGTAASRLPAPTMAPEAASLDGQYEVVATIHDNTVVVCMPIIHFSVSNCEFSVSGEEGTYRCEFINGVLRFDGE